MDVLPPPEQQTRPRFPDRKPLGASALQILGKQYQSQHIKVQQDIYQDDYDNFHVVQPSLVPSNQSQPMIRAKVPPNSVLMLTQETQTENRTLIKYLLTLINETIMKQLEEQSVRMTKEDFQLQVDHYTQAIPQVYENVRNKSDQFFVEEQTRSSQLAAQAQNTHQSQMQQNRDLKSMIEHVVEKRKEMDQENQYAGGVVVNKRDLSPTSSQKMLHQSPSQKRLQKDVSAASLPGIGIGVNV